MGNWIVFTFLAIMKKAAMNIHIYIFVWIIFFIFLGQILRSGIAGSCSNSIFNISRNLQLLSKIVVPFKFPSKMSNFSTSLLTLVFVCLLHCSHPSETEMVFYCICVRLLLFHCGKIYIPKSAILTPFEHKIQWH